MARKRRNTFSCIDCRVDCLEIHEYYMVNDSVWSKTGVGPHGGMLCIGCLEKRLGRRLTSRNFTDCPLNWRNVLVPGYSSERLLSRLTNSEKSKFVRKVADLMFLASDADDPDAQSKMMLRVQEMCLL